MAKKAREFFVIAHNMRSLYNVGSIFRSADAFGVSKIYLTGYTGNPGNFVQNKRIAKSSLGAEQTVPWEYSESPQATIRVLKKQGVKIIALENNVVGSKPLNKFKPKFPLALLLGEEVKGVSGSLLKLCDEVIEIPMKGKKESLNVSVAFGIAAYTLTL